MVSYITTPQKTSWMETPPRSPALRHLSWMLLARMPWIDQICKPLQGWITKRFGQPEEPAYKVKDFLNGVWLGHVLHPVFVTVPLGAWSTTLMLDLVWLFEKNKDVARSADLTMWLGLVGAGASAVTGATNWVDTDGAEQRMGMLHALLNSGLTGLNLTSAILRTTGKRRYAIALSTLSYAIALYSAYLGGELSYSAAIGVNRVAWQEGSDEFVAVMDEKDLVPGKPTRVDAAGIPAVLLKDGSTIYALAATCSHLGGPLDEGTYENGVISCPWHRSGFRVCDGSVAHSPAVYAQPTFAVRTNHGKIELRRLEHA